METKHTPGPWHLEEETNSVNKYGVKEISINAPGVESLASVYAGSSFEDEGEANSKLICAAPELLHALKLAISTPWNEWRSEHREICINAIKKATL